ncbi:MAG: DUF1549 domain-containing protein [Planctomycetota bacterium]|nr:DUF1549 domain-containing protein [Planctomycetota bacterium]
MIRYQLIRTCLIAVTWLLLPQAVVCAAEPRDAQRIADQIDSAIEHGLQQRKLTAVAISDDVEFLRRAYIDISGRIPTAQQATAFLENSDKNKRRELIDALLADKNFGEQLGRVWRDWIAPAELPSEGNGGNQPIKATRNLGIWFAEQFNANERWDKIVESVINVDGNLKDHPQGLFYSLVGTDTGIAEPAGATRAISSLFLGVDLQCAQCHDDPYREWKQTDFWGTAAFFRNMESKFNGRYFDSITESFGKKLGKGGKKTNTGDASPNGSISIPNDSFKNAGNIVPARLVLSDTINAQDNQALRPIFAKWLVSTENPYFARAFVNRLWSYYFARGLVMPIDDMRPSNAASHPEVLQLLTKEVIDSGFNVKHLVRCLVNTRAWQRTSVAKQDVEQRAAAAFGRRPVKLMSADQLYDSLKLALDDPKLDLRTYDPKESNRFGESSPIGDQDTEFQRLFETDENDSTNFTHGIPQFLALLNHPRVSSGGPMVERLIKDKTEPAVAVKTLYIGTLSRTPSDRESTEAVEYINSNADRRIGYAGVLWMLLNRSEFMLVR